MLSLLGLHFHHFHIKPVTDNTVEIIDLSKNGTFVDGVRVAKDLAVEAEIGSVIRAGDVNFKIILK